jgi:hypothetical protein
MSADTERLMRRVADELSETVSMRLGNDNIDSHQTTMALIHIARCIREVLHAEWLEGMHWMTRRLTDWQLEQWLSSEASDG